MITHHPHQVFRFLSTFPKDGVEPPGTHAAWWACWNYGALYSLAPPAPTPACPHCSSLGGLTLLSPAPLLPHAETRLRADAREYLHPSVWRPLQASPPTLWRPVASCLLQWLTGVAELVQRRGSLADSHQLLISPPLLTPSGDLFWFWDPARPLPAAP